MTATAPEADTTLRTARTAVRYVLRGYRDRDARAEALSDALYGIARALHTHNPFLGSWSAYSLSRAISAVRDGDRRRAPLTRSQYAAGYRHVDQLLPHQRTPISLEGHVLEHPTWHPGGPDTDLDMVEDREHIRWLLNLVDGRQREVLVRYYLLEQTLLEIAAAWHVSESRVCSLKQTALRTVRARAATDSRGGAA